MEIFNDFSFIVEVKIVFLLDITKVVSKMFKLRNSGEMFKAIIIKKTFILKFHSFIADNL